MKQTRRNLAKQLREQAAEMAASRPHPRHKANGDEQKFRNPLKVEGKDHVKNCCKPSYAASFTKGLPHDFNTGLVAKDQYFEDFMLAIDSGDPRDIKAAKLGPVGYEPVPGNGNVWKSRTVRQMSIKEDDGEDENENEDKKREPCDCEEFIGVKLRAWESMAAGNAFDLEGPDSQAVTMPPAPAFGSFELAAEMAEVYVQALLRDVNFTDIVNGNVPDELLDKLGALPWFNPENNDGNAIKYWADNGEEVVHYLTAEERSRLRIGLKPQTFFRGITPGDEIGPYISQFLLAGNKGLNGNCESNEGRTAADGYINYGSISVDQRVRYAKLGKDYMNQWSNWYDVQQGADLSGSEEYSKITDVNGVDHFRRFITTPRDLATYVHYDALYEAYLNACLILLDIKAPFDPGLPFQDRNDLDHQQAFALYGGPHILSLVTEVATRALKAVRFQKFNVHRRLRPEALAARIAKQRSGAFTIPEVTFMADQMEEILQLVSATNPTDSELPSGNFLLPMPFAEGSPMHPSYGAGHATVAGACVTILKAFFDSDYPLTIAGNDQTAFVPTEDGLELKTVSVADGKRLTVGGELNKLASNISIGRDWAGVHYFTDYIESIRMGEQIAIGILEEQKLTYGENFSMTVPLFDGGTYRI